MKLGTLGPRNSRSPKFYDTILLILNDKNDAQMYCVPVVYQKLVSRASQCQAFLDAGKRSLFMLEMLY